MFENFRDAVRIQFNNLKKLGTLYTVAPNRDKIWETYLASFPEKLRQGNNCNCCKSFLRQFGGVVALDAEFKIHTLWDFELDCSEYGPAAKALQKFISGLVIQNHFFHFELELGTEKNLDKKRSVIWTHFHVQNTEKSPEDDIPTKQAKHRDAKQGLETAVTTLTANSVETVLDLINQNSLYRGNEFKANVQKLQEVQKKFEKTPKKLRANFFWKTSGDLSPAVCGIRNSSIGTLLQDISKGTEIDDAVRMYESIVAPTNYKRPKPIHTAKMVESARKELEAKGLLSAIERRQLNARDLTAENALFIYRKQKKSDNIFDQLKEEILVNPKSLGKIEEISITDFLEKVVPTAKRIKALFENSHAANLVALVGPQHEGPSLFKWDNNFSWSYAGEVADSIKERVKAAGGNVTGALRVSLSWHNHDDLDLHIVEPNGYRIYYPNKRTASPTGGMLDVDMNAGFSLLTRDPVENITWQRLPKTPGEYQILVNQFATREFENTQFEIELEIEGTLYNFTHSNPSNKQTTHIATLKVNKDLNIEVLGHTSSSTAYASKTLWGLPTGTFHQINAITLSPNHWETPTGNKHFFFVLDQCKADQKIRPFYNEFLNEELLKHRKTFEVLGGKVEVETTENELSGLGFSDTQRNHLFVEVESSFKRTLKIKF
jgi:hypothetical protein